MKLIDIITAQSARLKQAGVSFGHGTTNAFDEAAWLVLWTLKMPWDSLDTGSNRAISAADHASIEALVTRRIETRLPTAYLTQETWLQNVPFYVDQRSIVPRSFIAELLADGEGHGTLDAWLSDQTQRVLDLCTGNGSLAIIAAMAYPEVTLDAADIDTEALAVAQLNLDKHQLQHRIRLIESDLFSRIDGVYDLILCNPPYVNDQTMATLPAEYLSEPKLALAGGIDGMDLIRRIINDALRHLSPIGVLVLEVGNERRHFEHAFRRLEVAWLETSSGDNQVLLITQNALSRWLSKQTP